MKYKYTSDSGLYRRMSKNRIRSLEKKIEIFEAVAKVIAKKSSGEVNLDEISAVLGKSTGMIYYYFKSKADLFYQLRNNAFDLLENEINGVFIDSSLNSRQRLEKTIHVYVTTICDHINTSRVLWADPESSRTTAGQRRYFSRRRNIIGQKMQKLIEECINAEGLYCDDIKIATNSIWIILDHIARWYKKGGPLNTDDIANIIVNYIFKGFIRSR